MVEPLLQHLSAYSLVQELSTSGARIFPRKVGGEENYPLFVDALLYEQFLIPWAKHALMHVIKHVLSYKRCIRVTPQKFALGAWLLAKTLVGKEKLCELP